MSATELAADLAQARTALQRLAVHMNARATELDRKPNGHRQAFRLIARALDGEAA